MMKNKAEPFSLKTEMAEGESAAVIGPTRLPASRVASSYRCNRCEPGSLVEPSTTPSSSLSISVSRFSLKTEMAEGKSATVIGPTRLPASRVASSYRCNRCETGSLVELSTTPSSSLSVSVFRFSPRDGQISLLSQFAGEDAEEFAGFFDFEEVGGGEVGDGGGGDGGAEGEEF